MSSPEPRRDEAAERRAIEAAIPHRDPFLFVDRVVEEGDRHLVSSWRVPPDGSWFRGHYPGQPILPGALLSEHVFQTAALHVSHALGGLSAADGVPVLTKIEQARFRRVVRPGDTLSTRVDVDERVGPAWYFSGRVSLDGKKVAHLRFVLTATEAMARAGTPAAAEA